jgi:hypothetical protein
MIKICGSFFYLMIPRCEQTISIVKAPVIAMPIVKLILVRLFGKPLVPRITYIVMPANKIFTRGTKHNSNENMDKSHPQPEALYRINF